MPRPTQERIKYLLRYDRRTGHFFWRNTKARRIKNGDRAGTIVYRGDMRYRVINIDYTPHYEHALAWLYCHGEWLPEVDHCNGVGDENRIKNLRRCTSSQNKANCKKPKTNKSGYKGVCFASREGKWRATINMNRKQYHIGFFDDPAAAHLAYVAKSKDLFGEFARAA